MKIKMPENRQDCSGFGDFWVVSTTPIPFNFSKSSAQSKKMQVGENIGKLLETFAGKVCFRFVFIQVVNFLQPYRVKLSPKHYFQ